MFLYIVCRSSSFNWWHKIEHRIQYKVASITYKVLQPEKPSYLHSLLNVQSNRTTRSSNIITLQRPSVRSRLKVTDRYFTHHARVLWNSLPKQLRQPSAPPSLGTATDFTPPLALSSHQFHSKLKTFLFEQSFLQSFLHQLLSVLWPLDLANGFHLTVNFPSVVHFPLVLLRQCLWISLLSYSWLAGFMQAL